MSPTVIEGKKKFEELIKAKLDSCAGARYGLENAADYVQKEFVQFNAKATLKHTIKRGLNRHRILRTYRSDFTRLVDLLDEQSSNLLTELLAYRILGFRKVKLSINTPEFWEQMYFLKSLAGKAEGQAVGLFTGLKRFDLRKIGYDITIDYSIEGVMMDFVLEQYASKYSSKVQAEVNDTVLDLGGCWGDTALYFADKVGPGGHVHSFEFIPRNSLVFQWNRELNPHLKNRITLVERPVASLSDIPVYYQDKGPGSKVRMTAFKGMTGAAKTISIDDYVNAHNLRVNFIKMDIEGAEMMALEGATETIKKFKPKLAIAIYHSIHDMARIPNWIADLNLGYKLQLGHNTHFEDETVCFAHA